MVSHEGCGWNIRAKHDWKGTIKEALVMLLKLKVSSDWKMCI